MMKLGMENTVKRMRMEAQTKAMKTPKEKESQGRKTLKAAKKLQMVIQEVMMEVKTLPRKRAQAQVGTIGSGLIIPY